jgi:riboflavin kinase/FMN adenylyltransferase
MIVCQGNIDSFDIPKNLLLAIGNFDGVHLGHQKVISECIDIATQHGFTPAVLTFDPHTYKVAKPNASKKLICSNKKKIELFKASSLSHVFILKFDEAIMRLTHEEFVTKILVEKFNVKAVVTGYNFCFGNKRSGNIKFLKRSAKDNAFLYSAVEKFTQNNIDVSSSKIRELFSMGMIETANEMLGRAYEISGEVIGGKKLARTLGFKTANLALDNGYVYPLNGVYLVHVTTSSKEKFYGIVNIGVMPTVTKENKLSLEVLIFDFDQDIYEQEINVEFLRFIRPERTFESVQKLKCQIKKDVIDAKYLLSLVSTVL